MDKLAAYKYTILIVSILFILEHRPKRPLVESKNVGVSSRKLRVSQVAFDLTLFLVQVFVISEVMAIVGRLTDKFASSASPIRQALTLNLESLFPEIPTSITFLATAFMFLLSWDFFQYWSHRILHLGSLWTLIHKFHHGSRMYSLTTFRHHPMEHIFLHVTITIPTSAFYSFIFPTGNYFIFWIGASIQSLMLHSDLYLPRIPIVSDLLLTPNHHKIHHDVRRPRSVNFGQYFTIWDRIFGTYANPYQIELTTISTGFDHPFRENISQLLTNRGRN